MKTRRQRPPTTSASSTSTSGSLAASRCLDVCLQWAHRTHSLRKKSGRAPTLGTAADAGARRHESCRSSIASAHVPVCALRPARRRGGRGRGRAGSPRARGAASRPARAAGRPRGGARAAASSGPGRTARSRSWARSRRPPRTPRRRLRSAARGTARGPSASRIEALSGSRSRALLSGTIAAWWSPWSSSSQPALVEVVDALHRPHFSAPPAQLLDGVEDRLGDLAPCRRAATWRSLGRRCRRGGASGS